MRIISIINQKGGSGKTTTAVNLSFCISYLKRKVLLIDLDPQGSASSWLGVEDSGENLLSLFLKKDILIDDITVKTKYDVYLVPSGINLISTESQLAGDATSGLILREKLYRSSIQWDYVFIDCPPSLGLLSINALVASSELIVPVESQAMALRGLGSLMQTVEEVGERTNLSLNLSGIVICRMRNTNLSKDVINVVKNRFKDNVFNTIIRENVRIGEAPSFQEPVLLYAPDSNGAQDYLQLAKEVIKQEKNQKKGCNHE